MSRTNLIVIAAIASSFASLSNKTNLLSDDYEDRKAKIAPELKPRLLKAPRSKDWEQRNKPKYNRKRR